MNDILFQMKKMDRAFQSYVLMLYEIVFESNAQNVLEIGVRQGQSTRTTLSAMWEKKSGLLTTIDLGDRSSRFKEMPELLPYWKQIIGDSHKQEIFDQVSNVVYDILVIDGDHTYEGSKKDFEMYSPLVKKGGYILMHDITNSNEGVSKAWAGITLPKVPLTYGRAAGNIIPGLGIVFKE